MSDNPPPAEQPKPAKKKRNLTDEQRQILRERLAKYRPIINDKRKAEKQERLKKELERMEAKKKTEDAAKEEVKPPAPAPAPENMVVKHKETKPEPVKQKKPKYMKVVFYEKPNEDIPFKLKFGKKQRPTLHYVSPEVSEEEDESESDDEPVAPTRSVSTVPDYSQYFD